MLKGGHASPREPVCGNIVIAGVGRDGATTVSRLDDVPSAVQKLFLTASPTQVVAQSPALIRIRTDGSGRDELKAALAGTEMLVLVGTVVCREAALMPEVLELARRGGALAVAVLVEPLLSGAPRRGDAPDHVVSAVTRAADATVVVPADDEAATSMNISEAFEGWNKRLHASIRGLLTTAAAEDAMNLHMDDVAATLSKHCRSSVGVGLGQTVEEALRDAMASNVAPPAQLKTARSVLCHVVGGGDMPLDEARRPVFVLEQFFPKADLCCGVSIREGEAEMTATIIAGKLDISDARSRAKKRTAQAESPFFKVGDPTVYDGEYLDIPAFLRRDLVLPGAPPKPVPEQTTLFDAPRA